MVVSDVTGGKYNTYFMAAEAQKARPEVSKEK